MKKHIQKQVRTARYIFYKETLIDFKEHFWTFVGSFGGIALIGFFHTDYFSRIDQVFLIGSFGASAVLVYGLVNSPLAQPRNLIGGHVISAIVGVTVHMVLPDQIWVASAFAVSLSIVAMQMTKTLHPPGGATALIANIGSPQITSLGYMYVLSPVLTGVTILLLVAILINNRAAHRNYPANKDWYKIWKRRYR
ncbi:HPP family protein [Dyadobacter jejuensis]|uniref:HPP family protein n=1 Tax=Dyadobacter jejuensis TaxID=1082580 RepID=A0A316B9K0_9BACT|nr:HPP family protein [Dyadobacter jejuensis]PWJ59207.1 HPP family protein [Dyadobacter jejuensis]